MLDPASKLLELLKASGWQSTMIAVASWLLIYLGKSGDIPHFDSQFVELSAWVVALLSSGLAAASFCAFAAKYCGIAIKSIVASVQRKLKQKKFRRLVLEEISNLSQKEIQILGYLREKNQKVFEADTGGGNASTLISRGWISIYAAYDQQIELRRCPFKVNDIVWDIIQSYPDSFPYKRENYRGQEIAPWRRPEF
ncbi:MAG: hypothetical protein GYB52_03035 [Rhodospirillales bacterium]|nr:hypothetical protein [Rhodospirillales bacterium]MBR9815581.1 hypothetical protein [Rhodospirillales bacterium]